MQPQAELQPASEAKGGPAPCPWRAFVWLQIAAGAGVFAVHLALSRPWEARAGPVLYDDSLAYFAMARLLAGRHPVHLLASPSLYRCGYSLLLAPLCLLLRAPRQLFAGTVVLDSLLASLQLPLLHALLRRLEPRLLPGEAFLAALAATVYPSFLLQSGFAWTESLFAFLVCLQALVAVHALATTRRAAWVAFALAGGLLDAVHPRGEAIALVTALAILCWARPDRSRNAGRPDLPGSPASALTSGADDAALQAPTVISPPAATPQASRLAERWPAWVFAAIPLACLAGAMALSRRLDALLAARLWIHASMDPGTHVLALLTDPRQLAQLPLRLAGHLWYLEAATLGVAMFGALALTRLALSGPLAPAGLALSGPPATSGLALSRPLAVARLAISGPLAVARLAIFGPLASSGLARSGAPTGCRLARSGPRSSAVEGPGPPASGATATAASRTACFLLAAAAAVALASALYMLPARRSDHLVYGRYNEALLGPLLAMGASSLLVAGRRRLLLVAACGAGVLATLGVVVVRTLPAASWSRAPAPLNVLGLLAFTTGAEGTLEPARITLLGLAAGGLLVLLACWRGRAAVVALSAFFILSAAAVSARVLVPFTSLWSQFIGGQLLLARAGFHGTLAFDRVGLRSFTFHGYPFWLDGVAAALFDSRLGEQPPAELVVASRGWGTGRPGVRLAYPERLFDQALWVLPGPWQERLRNAGLLAAANPAAPLPAGACRVEISTGSFGPPRWSALPLLGSAGVRSGAAWRQPLVITHLGSRGMWLPLQALADPRGTVQVAARWYREPGGPFVGHHSEQGAEQGAEQCAEQRADLVRAMLPGDRQDLAITLAARSPDGRPLPPGRYRLRLSLVQQGGPWFDEAGGKPLLREVTVLPAR